MFFQRWLSILCAKESLADGPEIRDERRKKLAKKVQQMRSPQSSARVRRFFETFELLRDAYSNMVKVEM